MNLEGLQETISEYMKKAEDPLSVIMGQSVDHCVQCDDTCRGDNARLPHPATEALANSAAFGDECCRPA